MAFPPISFRDLNVPIEIGDIQISLVNVTNAHYDQMPPEAYERLDAESADIALEASRTAQSKEEFEENLKQEYADRLGDSDRARELAATMAHETAESVAANAEG